MNDHTVPAAAVRPAEAATTLELRTLLAPLQAHGRLLLLAPLMAGVVGVAGTFLVPPSFVSSTTILPSQQQQSSAASALASLGSLAGLSSGASGLKSAADQLVSLMSSVTVADRMIERFDLLTVYGEKLKVDARRELSEHVQISIGKKDGLITISVEDHDADRAAAMANQYVEELRRMTSTLAVSEAQQRRVFFERQLQDVKNRLTAAQTALQGSGFDASALRAEPKATAEGFARLRAELTTAEVRLQTLRQSHAESSAEVQQLGATVAALRAQVAEQGRNAGTMDGKGADYVSRYREFKYQETLFDLMAKQYELAKVDESREGALIQVVDPATPAERKSKPRRALWGAGTALATALALSLALVLRGRRKALAALAA